jgi:hypothetical protein
MTPNMFPLAIVLIIVILFGIGFTRRQNRK